MKGRWCWTYFTLLQMKSNKLEINPLNEYDTCKPYILIVKSVLIKTEDISYHHFNNAPLFNKVF